MWLDPCDCFFQVSRAVADEPMSFSIVGLDCVFGRAAVWALGLRVGVLMGLCVLCCCLLFRVEL